jgi:ferredoxin
MKLILDRALCDGNALCVAQAPDLLEMDDNEELVVLKAELAPDEVERARRAADACPKAALHLSPA